MNEQSIEISAEEKSDVVIPVSDFKEPVKRNKHVQQLLNWAIKSLTVIRDGEKQEIPDTAFSALSPIDDVNEEDFKVYGEALSWALNNRVTNDIKNIAVTGPYGSGKSSVLRTFQKKYENPNLRFLNISLATFKDEILEQSTQGEQTTEINTKPIKTTTSENNNPNSDLLRLIELSILQQIFYHEKDSDLPDSRFRKIKKLTWINIGPIAAGWMVLILSIILAQFPSVREAVWISPFTQEIRDIVIRILTVLATPVLFIFIWRSIRILSKIKISKISVQDAEIEISDSISKSILNHHLDELLYFFDKRPYNVVVIEDLDRFESTEVFTKLREMNLLINSSEIVNKHIVFIYAVKDGVFKDKERAKFFDFIVPIIPVVSSANSSQQLMRKNDANNYHWNEDLIEKIAYYVDDMRLIHNITNEFHIYRSRLGHSLDPNKLLSLLVYKNIHPDDFAELNNGQGKLFAAIHNKTSHIKTITAEADSKIIEIRTEIDRLERIENITVGDLRQRYIFRYIDQVRQFSSFVVGSANKSFDEMVSDENFDYLIANNAFYRSSPGDYERPLANFAVIESKVDANRTYEQYLNDLKEIQNSKIQQQRDKILEIECEKMQFSRLKIKDILKKGGAKISFNDDRQGNLVNELLRNGYIDETYSNFISIFYEGTITKEDYQFYLNINNSTSTPFEYGLKKFDALIKKIHLSQFEEKYILNYGLADFIIRESYKPQREAFFKLLSTQTEQGLSFLAGMLENSAELPEFVKLLSKQWPGVWKFIANSVATEDAKNDYFKAFLNYSELADIKEMSVIFSFKPYIDSNSRFLTLVPDGERLKGIIKQLGIKLKNIDGKETNDDVLKYVYENNYYEISPSMLNLMISKFGKFNHSDFDTRNYHAVMKSEAKELLKYINEQIDDYITNVYIKIATNIEEDQKALVTLLNNENLAEYDAILELTHTKVENLADINDVDISKSLIFYSLVVPTWDNLVHYYSISENSFDESAIAFIDDDNNIAELSKTKMPWPKNTTRSDEAFIFIDTLLAESGLTDAHYEMLLKSVPYFEPIFDSSRVTTVRAKMLVKYLLTVSVDNFDSLKEQHGLQISLLEKNIALFIKDFEKYTIDDDDILQLLKSNVITNMQKSQIISKVEQGIITADPQILKEIGMIALSDKSFQIADLIARAILMEFTLSDFERVSLFTIWANRTDNVFVKSMFSTMKGKYRKLSEKLKKPNFTKNDIHIQLAEILDSKKYISSKNTQGKEVIIRTFGKD